jgi:hypothetical protein
LSVEGAQKARGHRRPMMLPKGVMAVMGRGDLTGRVAQADLTVVNTVGIPSVAEMSAGLVETSFVWRWA